MYYTTIISEESERGLFTKMLCHRLVCCYRFGDYLFKERKNVITHWPHKTILQIVRFDHNKVSLTLCTSYLIRRRPYFFIGCWSFSKFNFPFFNLCHLRIRVENFNLKKIQFFVFPKSDNKNFFFRRHIHRECVMTVLCYIRNKHSV